MNLRTWPFLFFAAGFTGLAVAMVSHSVVGREWAPVIGMCAGWSYFAFASQPRRTAILMASSIIISMLGMNYFRFVRHDALGVGVLLIAIATGAAIVLAGKRHLNALAKAAPPDR